MTDKLTGPDSSTCKRNSWCTSHDDEIDQCVSPYTLVPLALETPKGAEPVEMHIRLETNPDEPGDTWVVLFRPDGDGGAAMTPQEAARVACELWQIAAKGQAAA